jgi:hypothetical protein
MRTKQIPSWSRGFIPTTGGSERDTSLGRSHDQCPGYSVRVAGLAQQDGSATESEAPQGKLPWVKQAERLHLARVAALGCICPLPDKKGWNRCEAPAEIHHILNGTMGRKASNYEAIPLCPYHHRQGPFGEAVHNGTRSFEAKYGSQREMLETVRRLL